MRMEADFYPSLPCFAHMNFGKHQRHIRLEGRMTPDQSMAADFLGQPRHAEGFSRQVYILRNSMVRRRTRLVNAFSTS